MPATPDSRARTRAFARVIGPFIVIAPGIIVARASDASMATTLSAFFANEALVWITGGLLLLVGIVIIAQHQYWSSLEAVIISLFGWFLALRGLVLLAAPQWILDAARAGLRGGMLPIVQGGFGLLVLSGLWLAYVGWIRKPAADHKTAD